MGTGIRFLGAILLGGIALATSAPPALARYYPAEKQEWYEFSSVGEADFELPRLGEPRSKIRLSEFARGYYTAVVFFSSTCPLAELELPAVEEFYLSIPERGRLDGKRRIPARIIGVAIDALGERELIPYVEERNFSFPIVLDPLGVRTGKTYKLEELGIPLIVLYRPDGTLVGIFRGVERYLSDRLWEVIFTDYALQQMSREGEG